MSSAVAVVACALSLLGRSEVLLAVLIHDIGDKLIALAPGVELSG
jgi:hypothetical protein